MMHTAYDELWPVVESRDQIHYPFVKKGKVTTRKQLVSCLKPPPPPHPCPLSRIVELMFESNPCQRYYPKNWKKNDPCKHWIHVRDLAERLASLCAVVGCLILDVHLLIKSSKYLLHDCAWLIAIQRISDWSKLYNHNDITITYNHNI